MADAIIVTCPECAKKFKPRTDVRGKKIKCPLCAQAFVVPATKDAKAENGKSAAIKEGKPKPKDAKAAQAAAAVAESKKAAPDEYDDKNPYDVKHIEVVPRCPNCTTEMGPHDIICLECGYNTLTRQWGKTEKTKGVTGREHLKYLAPALGSAAFVVFSVIFLIFYDTVAPNLLGDPALNWLDSESMRMWTTVIVLAWIYGAGMACFKKFLEKPKPDEMQMD